VYRTCLDECEATQVSSNYMKNKKRNLQVIFILIELLVPKGGGEGVAKCVFFVT